MLGLRAHSDESHLTYKGADITYVYMYICIYDANRDPSVKKYLHSFGGQGGRGEYIRQRL